MHQNLRFVGLGWTISLVILLLSGCKKPCETLAARICEETKTEERCAQWREIALSASPETCEKVLLTLETTVQK